MPKTVAPSGSAIATHGSRWRRRVTWCPSAVSVQGTCWMGSCQPVCVVQVVVMCPRIMACSSLEWRERPWGGAICNRKTLERGHYTLFLSQYLTQPQQACYQAQNERGCHQRQCSHSTHLFK